MQLWMIYGSSSVPEPSVNESARGGKEGRECGLECKVQCFPMKCTAKAGAALLSGL